jgi:hypothetical protein
MAIMNFDAVFITLNQFQVSMEYYIPEELSGISMHFNKFTPDRKINMVNGIIGTPNT